MESQADDFLAHYGVLGMKWGKRKSKPAYNESVKTFGSHNLANSRHHPVNASTIRSKDAKVTQSYHARAKAGGSSALSTKELQTLVTRQNLEQQYAKLNPSKVSTGAKIASLLIPAAASILISQVARHTFKPHVSTMSTALAIMPTGKQKTLQILLASGKQLISDQGLAVGRMLLKALLG